MKNIQIITTLLVSVMSATVVAEQKNDFGRDNILVAADPATLKLMRAVVEKVDAKFFKAKPVVELRYPRKSLKLLCLGTGSKYPDLVASTREMNEEEFKRCQNNNIGTIVKLKIGYEALVVVANKKAIELNLDPRQFFLATAKNVPNPKLKGVLMANNNKTWKDIDPEASKQAIKILGPAGKSRTERTVKILGLETGCRSWDWIADMKNIQKSYRLYREVCWLPRDDGLYVKTDTNLTEQLLSDKTAIGLMDFNTWLQSKDKLKAYSIDELPPTIGTISKGLYPFSQAYYVYIKIDSLKKVSGLAHFMNELANEKTLGAKGYLADIGMIAMPEKELKREVEQALELTAMTKSEDL